MILADYAINAQTESDSLKLGQIRKESGVDTTRIQSRAGYSFMVYGREGAAGQINNRVSLSLGVNHSPLIHDKFISKTPLSLIIAAKHF